MYINQTIKYPSSVYMIVIVSFSINIYIYIKI